MMKKVNLLQIIIIAIVAMVLQSVLAQAKKPTIMVVPSDVWCYQNVYTSEFNKQGTIEKIPNYKKAFQENPNLFLVISKINGLMADRGFPLKNLESVLKSIQAESAETAMLTSKGGSEVVESPIDILRKTAKADIIIQLTWTL